MEHLKKLCAHKSMPGEWKQLLVTLIADLQILTCGIQTGWSAPTTPLLQSDNPPVGTEPMTDHEIGLLNASGYIAAILIVPFCANLAENFGKKIMICVAAMLTIICSISTAFSTSYISLFGSRVFGAMGGAISVALIPIYVCEISCEKTRARNGSIFGISVCSGILIAYTMGDYLSYQENALATSLFPLSFLLLFVFMPETPIYLMRKCRIEEATSSLMWLKNNDKSCVEEELEKLEKVVKATAQKWTGWRCLFRDRATVKGFIISICLLATQVLAGMEIVVAYTVHIFQTMGSTMRPNTSAIIIGLMQVIATIPFALIIEHAGRRPMLMLSSLTMMIMLCVLGGFGLAQTRNLQTESLEWIPMAALSIYVVAYSCGVGPVPYIIIVEIFHPDVVSHANSLCIALSWVLMAATFTTYPFVIEKIDYHGCFFIFAFSCMLMCLFTWAFVPETKSTRIESIVDDLNKSWIYNRTVKKLESPA